MPPSEPRRILLAIGVYQPGQGGASEWLGNYARWLSKRGHHVTIACESADGPPPDSCVLLTLPPSQHTKNSWRRALALQNLVDKCSADVVHDTGCLPGSDVFHPLMGSLWHNWQRQLQAFPIGLRLRRLAHIRLWRDLRLQWRQRRRHRVLVACSRIVAADFARIGCSNAVVIPNGIPVSVDPTEEAVRRVRDELNPEKRVLVLVTATNFYLKGVMTVLRALALLDQETRKKFLVIITGPNRDAIFQETIDRFDLNASCRLAGWVKDIGDYYSAADIFLHPTHHDAGSLSTLKALAAGCAVVTSRFDGSAERIEHGVNGLVLDRPGDAAKLAGTLRELLNADRRCRLSAAARELAPSLGEEHQFQRLEALYGEVVAKKIRSA